MRELGGDVIDGEYGIENSADALLMSEAKTMFDALRTIAIWSVTIEEMRSLARKAICVIEDFDPSGYGVQA